MLIYDEVQTGMGTPGYTVWLSGLRVEPGCDYSGRVSPAVSIGAILAKESLRSCTRRSRINFRVAPAVNRRRLCCNQIYY